MYIYIYTQVYIYNLEVFPRWPQSMGCVPSTNLSDSRVICHSSNESEEYNFPHQTNTTMSQQQQGNPVPGLFIKCYNTSTYEARTNSSKKDKRENSQSMEAEAQTGRANVKVKRVLNTSAVSLRTGLGCSCRAQGVSPQLCRSFSCLGLYFRL